MLFLITFLVFLSVIAALYFAGAALLKKRPGAWVKAGALTVLGLLILPAMGGSMLPRGGEERAKDEDEVKPTPPSPPATSEKTLDQSASWVGTVDDMKKACEAQIERQFGQKAEIRGEGPLTIAESDGGYVLSGFITNRDRGADLDCFSPSAGQYEIRPLKPGDSAGLARIQQTVNPSSAADKLYALGLDPNRDVIETDNDAGRHHYLWNRPDLGGRVEGVWYSKSDFWVKIREPAFRRDEIAADLKEASSNGVATRYIIQSGPLKGGYYIEAPTQVNIYSDAPRWHELYGN